MARPRAEHRDTQQSLDLVADLAAQLDRLHAELEQSDRLATLGMMAAAVAHELNNILTPVLSYAQLALARPEDGELVRKALERSEAGAGRAAEIVGSMLDLARPPLPPDPAEPDHSTGPAESTDSTDPSDPLDPADSIDHAAGEAVKDSGGAACSCDVAGGRGLGSGRADQSRGNGVDRSSGGGVAEVAAEVGACLKAALACSARPLEKDGITLERRVAAGLVAPLRPLSLEQFFVNTIGNARDAIRPRRGFVRVHAECSTWNNAASWRRAGAVPGGLAGSGGHGEAADRVLIGAGEFGPVVVGDEVDGAWEAAGEGRAVVVCVSDTGSGVPLKIVESVFDPLVTRKQRGGERPGTGLGLAICRRVVHGAGGRLWIWSQPSVGTAVVAALPVR